MLVSLFHLAEGIVVFLAILMVLVAAHEYGHYIFARLFGMGVEEFSIGMFGRRPLVTWLRRKYRIPLKPGEDPNKRSSTAGLMFEGGAGVAPKDPEVIEGPTGPELVEQTDFTIRPWPIGGFVRIKGMLPEEDGGEVKVPGGFYSKSPWKRLVVLFAGPLFSVLAGVLVMIPVYMAVGDVRFSNKPLLPTVLKGKPAYEGGLRDGDRVLSIDGKPVRTFYDIVTAVQGKQGQRLDFTFERHGLREDAFVTPYLSAVPLPVKGPDLLPTGEVRQQAVIGVYSFREVDRLELKDAVVAALDLPLENLQGVAAIIHQPQSAEENVGGPVSMVAETVDEVQAGFVEVVRWAAFISIAVGIFNLLPIYPLDGGQMAVAIAEILRGGRRLSLRVQSLVATIGLGLVLLMFVCVLTIDVGRLTRPSKADSFPAPAKDQHTAPH